ncbi:MAG: hypothetical protein PHY92_06200 [Alphaproteobacteria bacterium]|nr:hypothetical protein [Alphaproteobacteria bacterium]
MAKIADNCGVGELVRRGVELLSKVNKTFPSLPSALLELGDAEGLKKQSLWVHLNESARVLAEANLRRLEMTLNRDTCLVVGCTEAEERFRIPMIEADKEVTKSLVNFTQTMIDILPQDSALFTEVMEFKSKLEALPPVYAPEPVASKPLYCPREGIGWRVVRAP